MAAEPTLREQHSSAALIQSFSGLTIELAKKFPKFELRKGHVETAEDSFELVGSGDDGPSIRLWVYVNFGSPDKEFQHPRVLPPHDHDPRKHSCYEDYYSLDDGTRIFLQFSFSEDFPEEVRERIFKDLGKLRPKKAAAVWGKVPAKP